jgi:hypothetical protein
MYVGPDVAYKSVEIDDRIYREELEFIRQTYWKINESIEQL